MTKSEFESLGLTTEQYKEMFDEEPIIEDDVQETTESTEPAKTETTVEASEVVQEEPAKAEEAQATVDAIVPAEAKAEVIKTGAAMSFANIKAAAEYLAKELNLKLTNTLDGLYKTKRRGTSKNHGYIVTFNEDKTVALAKIEK